MYFLFSLVYNENTYSDKFSSECISGCLLEASLGSVLCVCLFQASIMPRGSPWGSRLSEQYLFFLYVV